MNAARRPAADFVEWLWSKRQADFAFMPNTLTVANLKDESLPRPPLSQIEAEGVFKHLEELKLVFPVSLNGYTAYGINQTKPYEWDAEIKELRKSPWRRSKTVAAGLKFSGWILSLIAAGFIGGVSRKAADDFYDARRAKITVGEAVPEVKRKDADKQKTSAGESLKVVP